MKNTLIAGAILYAIYRFAPNAPIKAMALGAAGTMAAAQIPYLNGKDVKGAVLA